MKANFQAVSCLCRRIRVGLRSLAWWPGKTTDIGLVNIGKSQWKKKMIWFGSRNVVNNTTVQDACWKTKAFSVILSWKLLNGRWSQHFKRSRVTFWLVETLFCGSKGEDTKKEVSQNWLIREQEWNLQVHAFSFRDGHTVLPQGGVQGPYQGSRTSYQNHKVQQKTLLTILKSSRLLNQETKLVVKCELNKPYLMVQVWRILPRIIHQDQCRRVPVLSDLKRSTKHR